MVQRKNCRDYLSRVGLAARICRIGRFMWMRYRQQRIDSEERELNIWPDVIARIKAGTSCPFPREEICILIASLLKGVRGRRRQ